MSGVLNTKYGKVKTDKDGYYVISSTKEGNKDKLLHRLIWIEHYGPIPDGDYVVHHKDNNPLNNNINNLELMTRAEHASHHHKGKTLTEEHCKKISEANKDKTFSEEHCKKLSETHKGEKNGMWKGYARVVKGGITPQGKQKYILIGKDGKYVKSSINKERLDKLAEELN